MGLTKKDYEAVAQDHAGFFAFTKRLEVRLRPWLLPLARLITRPAFIRRRVYRWTPARIGRISGLRERGEHAKAAELAIKTLKEYRARSLAKRPAEAPASTPEYWWFFVHLAADCLKDLEDWHKRGELIALAESVERPQADFDAAASFLAFARWKDEVGDYEDARAFAEIAADADPTWAEPDFLLGWYCLTLGGGGALEYLKDAVRKDPQVYFRIASNPECRRYPHIVQSLKALSSESLVTTGSSLRQQNEEQPAE